MNKVKDNENSNYIEKCQKLLLPLLCFVDSLCRENNIKYSLSCGTMLGAVREKGFIKWDDDADIIFTREEYDKFLKILKDTKLPTDIGVYYPEEKKYFLDFNVRLFNKKEVIRNDIDSAKKYDGLYRYAMLDIFVLDYIPENRLANRKFVFAQQFIFGLAMSKRDGIKYEKYDTFEKFAIMFLSFFGKSLSVKDICKAHDNASIDYFKKSDKLYCTSWSPEYPGYQYSRELFSNYIDIKFENKKFMITKDYDKVLAIDYGKDYMKPKKTHLHNDFVNKL